MCDCKQAGWTVKFQSTPVMTQIHACKIIHLIYIVIGNIYVQEGQVVLVLQGNLGIQQSPIMRQKKQLKCEQWHASFHGTTILYNNFIIVKKMIVRTVNKGPKVKLAEPSRICLHEKKNYNYSFKRRFTSKNLRLFVRSLNVY